MCLLVIFVVVAYDVLVIQSFSEQEWVPVVRYHRTLPLGSFVEYILSNSCGMVSSVGIFYADTW